MQTDNFSVKTFPGIDAVGLSSESHKLRVCIATEEILGPVRNGGIASTYYHLSKGLAANGHEVHVLFLKGRVVQDETPEYWIKHFADFGVTLHYLEFPEQPLWGASVEWQQRFVAAYRWLRDQKPFDVLHTSEWRGGMVYALMAKRLGLAFKETLFIVKTSSPHIWNRHYQMHPIARRELVLAAYAEQKCVELADVVIGGSAHLITFMEHVGYMLPKSNVFVQPNIVDFSKVIVSDQRPPRNPGDLVKTKELIFFGRLEARKGVELMCNALDILSERGISPERVSFMGKWGAPLATQGGVAVEDYIIAKTEAWNFPVSFITDMNQPAALSHMCSRDMIAVMPSLIENSTMAVYETLENNIPFIATAVGGTPELIDPVDHKRCLVEPKATALADQLERVLRDGQIIARPNFSNDENLETWYKFHAYIGERMSLQTREKAIAEIVAGIDEPGTPVESVSLGLLVRQGDELDDLVSALKCSAPEHVVLGYNDASMRVEVNAAAHCMRSCGINVDVLDCIGQAAGDSLNKIVNAQDSDVVAIGHGVSALPQPGYFDAAKVALASRPSALFTTFFTDQNKILGMPIGGDVASQFLSARAYGPELFAMRKTTYERLGEFEPYDVRFGILHEYITRAVESGPDDLLVFPEELLSWDNVLEQAGNFTSDTVYSYLKAKPLIDASSLAQRKIILAALHNASQSGSSLGDKELRDGGRAEDELLWLMPVDWDRNDISSALKREVVVGLDEVTNTLWLLARGSGDRRLSLRNVPQKIETVETIGKEGDENFITLSRFNIPETWETGTTFPISLSLYENERKRSNQFLRINKISEHTFTLAARHPILTRNAMNDLLTHQREISLLVEHLGPEATGGLSKAFAAVSEGLDKEFLQSLRINHNTTILSCMNGVLGTEDIDVTIPNKSKIDNTTLKTLLDIALSSGRRGMERQLLRHRSNRLLNQLGDQPVSAHGDIRSFLNPPKSKDGWVKNDWLTGWAWDRNDKERILHIAIVQDSRPLFVVSADLHVPSLGVRTPGLEYHGFRIPVVAEFLDLNRGKITLEVWENRAPVRNGTMKPSMDSPERLIAMSV